MAGVGGTITADGNTTLTGIVTAAGGSFSGNVTATAYSGDGSALTGIESWNQQDTWLYGG